LHHPFLPSSNHRHADFDNWLHEVMRIEGLPIPYGAPDASPHIERFMQTLRKEALDQFIFLSADHVRRVVSEFIWLSALQRGEALAGDPRDPRSVSKAQGAAAQGGTSRGASRPRRHPYDYRLAA
jgi:hypothetical protein